MKTRVLAVVATLGRPRELERLLASLDAVEFAVICDNGGSDEVRQVVEQADRTYLAPGTNLGCGGGLRCAEEEGWRRFAAEFTHLLVVDDDALLNPDTIPLLAGAMAEHGAVAAYPLVTGPEGKTGWLPGLRDRRLHRLSRTAMDPQTYRAALGQDMAEFEWAQGVCLLATRAAVEATGFHRDDFWVRGEDLDFSLRLTSVGRGIFFPKAVAEHLPPLATGKEDRRSEYLRHAAMLQNIAFLSLRQRHGRRIADSLLGASRRFLRTWGSSALMDLLRALYRGGFRGEPAGRGWGDTFLSRHG